MEDGKIWDLAQGRPVEYLAAIRIRDAAISVGEELTRNFPIGKRERENELRCDGLRRTNGTDQQ